MNETHLVIYRYDIDGKGIYREDAWDGIYTKSMFEPLAEGEKRMPLNFLELLDSTFGAVDETIIQFDSDESIKE